MLGEAEAKGEKAALERRSAPSLARTVQALRAIRGREARKGAEARISMRGRRQLT